VGNPFTKIAREAYFEQQKSTGIEAVPFSTISLAFKRRLICTKK
jgi:hypothetical protein